MKWVYNADETGKNLKNIDVYKDGKLQGTLINNPRPSGESAMVINLPEKQGNLEFIYDELFQFYAPIDLQLSAVDKNTIMGMTKAGNKLNVRAKSPDVDLAHSKWINFTK